MNAFNYVAKDPDGNVIRAVLNAASKQDALSSLKQRGLTVVAINAMSEGMEGSGAAAEPAADPSSSRRIRMPRTSIKSSDIAEFCRMMATSIQAGIPLRDAVEAITEDADHPGMRKVLQQVLSRLHAGGSFSEALAEFPTVFGRIFIALIRTAEEAGSMPQTLRQLTGYLERTERLKRKIKTVTAYPLFVMGFFCVVCLIMTLFILPQFQDIFSGFKAELPALTRAVFAINKFLIGNILPILLFALGVGVAGWLVLRTDKGRYTLDRRLLAMPFIGPILLKYALARFSYNLSIMISGGVPVTDAFQISSSVTGNRYLESMFLRARDRIIEGSDISGSLRQEAELPRLFVRMVSVGETSGQLTSTMETMAEAYEEQVEGQIMMATSLFEPIVICLFGSFVLVLVLAIYMPVFSVASSMGG